MIKYELFILFLILYIKLSLCLRLPRNTNYLASTFSLYKQLNKQWLLINKIDPSTEKIIKNDLLSQINRFNLDKTNYEKVSKKLDKIAHKITTHILKNRKKFYLDKDCLVVDIKDSSFLTEIFSFFKKDPLVYSIWNLKPYLLYKKADVVIEIQYKFPIEIKGIPKFNFNPIVTYTLCAKTGKHVSSKLSKGVIKLHTHPFIPWKTYNIGTFNIYPPLVKLLYNV